MMNRIAFVALASTLVVAPLAIAQDAPATTPDAAPAVVATSSTPVSSAWDPSIRRVGVTVSPLHFAIGFEGAVEYLVSPQLGLVGIFGTGEASSEGIDFSWREIGGQARYYIGKNGKGLHVGAEFMNIEVELEEGLGSIEAMAGGNAFGPLVGWKGVWGAGFTFTAQGGYQFMSVEAEATDGEESARKSDSGSDLLLNLDLGWSF